MPVLKVRKEVGSVPTPTASTLYFIRVGDGLDIQVTNSSGQVVKANYVKTVNSLPIDATGNVKIATDPLSLIYLISRGQMPVGY